MERCGMLPNTEMDVCHEISPLQRDNFNEKKHLYHLPKKPLNWSAKKKYIRDKHYMNTLMISFKCFSA